MECFTFPKNHGPSSVAPVLVNCTYIHWVLKPETWVSFQSRIIVPPGCSWHLDWMLLCSVWGGEGAGQPWAPYGVQCISGLHPVEARRTCTPSCHSRECMQTVPTFLWRQRAKPALDENHCSRILPALYSALLPPTISNPFQVFGISLQPYFAISCALCGVCHSSSPWDHFQEWKEL